MSTLSKDLGLEALSSLTIFSKYAKYIPTLKRRETWNEIVDRYELMMIKKYPHLTDAILKSSVFIREKKVLPSMRALQFAGPAAEVNNARIYNCCFLPIDSLYSFSETMFLLLGGTGVGYSVQTHHVNQLPAIKKSTKLPKNYLVEDSIMGWADAVKVLLKSYMSNTAPPIFDFRAVREKGARLVTAGGKAPGPEPLKLCLTQIKTILDRKIDGDKLTPIECHDILCFIANSVLAGGIRRSAMISLFDLSDEEMITSKSSSVVSKIISKEHPTYTSKNGLEQDLSKYILTVEQNGVIYKNVTLHMDIDSDKFWDLEQFESNGTFGWWVCNEQRGRANNSAVLERGVVTQEQFVDLWKKIEDSGSGEPGSYWTHNKDWGTNPCCEIGLRPYQFCNLCEINVSDIVDQTDLNDRVGVAAFFGTLQAGFTNFHYLRPIWEKTTQKDALLGIGMTGIGSGEILKYNLEIAANTAKIVNSMISEKIGTNEASRITCIKPSGTTSLVLGTASGIHAWHAPYYLRTMRFNKNEDIAMYLMINHPELCEDDQLRPKDTVCVRIPVKAPEGSIFRTETAIDTLERVKKFSQEWIKPGHITGDNSHNVSATISIDVNRKYYYTDLDYNEELEDVEWEWRDIPELYGKTPTVSQEIDYSGVSNEWEAAVDWMWENREFYNGLSVLPYSGGSYLQAPFEDITEEEYNRRISILKPIDLTKVLEQDDLVDFGQVAACAGGACSIE